MYKRQIYDIYAVRVILDSLAECYSTLGLIHDMYHPLPNRFKDYISTPKPNGYQSLHKMCIRDSQLSAHCRRLYPLQHRGLQGDRHPVRPQQRAEQGGYLHRRGIL